LDNKDLRKRIEDLRKEKLAVATLLETIKNQRDNLKMKYEDLFINNEEALKRKLS
jgi:argininosuccinate lyase